MGTEAGSTQVDGLPAIVALTEIVPEWAASARMEDLAHWPRGDSSAGSTVVLVDALLLAQQDRGWAADIESVLGPVVVVSDEPGSGSGPRVPRSLLHAPAGIARAVLEDLVGSHGTADSSSDPSSPERLERFMRDAIHEFRTPLTVISEFAGLCEDGIGGPLTDRQESYIGHILAAVERMGEQFDDFRDGLRMRLGTLEHGDAEAPLLDTVRLALGTMEVELDEGSFASLAGRPVRLDSERLPVAMRRVVAGAKKLSAKGESVGVSARPGAAPDCVEILVAYTGVELSQDDVVVMGSGTSMRDDGFYRSVSRVFGLGVSMARLFLLQSGGRMGLETRSGGGTFALVLPLG